MNEESERDERGNGMMGIMVSTLSSPQPPLYKCNSNDFLQEIISSQVWWVEIKGEENQYSTKKSKWSIDLLLLLSSLLLISQGQHQWEENPPRLAFPKDWVDV